jgi:manganese-dependent ADP-ribose/CDP-alcohol diphosphatase
MKSIQLSAIILTIILSLLLFTISCLDKQNKSNHVFSFGVLTDCQYDSGESTGIRKYSLSESKLKDCVKHFNTMNLEFVIHLGDFIDKNFKNFDVVGPIYNQLTIPNYHVLGNHDFSVEDNKKEMVYKKLGMPSKYYDFTVNGWHFVVLDGNDISFHAYPRNTKKYKMVDEYYKHQKIKSPKWNGAIGEKQISWIESVLKKATRNGEMVVLFCHFPVYPENIHNLWNADEIIELIDHYPIVKVFINGHNHTGNYGIQNGVHYLTLKGMVDTDNTSYAVLKVFENKIEASGYGREINKRMSIKATLK